MQPDKGMTIITICDRIWQNDSDKGMDTIYILSRVPYQISPIQLFRLKLKIRSYGVELEV